MSLWTHRSVSCLLNHAQPLASHRSDRCVSNARMKNGSSLIPDVAVGAPDVALHTSEESERFMNLAEVHPCSPDVMST